MSAQDHIAKAAAFIAVAEASDSKREAYVKAADEIIAAQKDDPTLTFREIDRQIGKSKSGKYSGDLVRWRTSASTASTPFARTENDTRDRTAARSILRDRPELIIDEVAAAMRNPKIAKAVTEQVMTSGGKAAEAVRQAAEDDEERRVRARREAGQKGAATKAHGTPLHQHLWRMLSKFTEWTQGLRTIAADIDDLAGNLTTEEYERLLERHRDLRDHAQANIDLLEARVAEPEDVIDGTARAGTRRKLAS